jgi:hypothetical protein
MYIEKGRRAKVNHSVPNPTVEVHHLPSDPVISHATDYRKVDVRSRKVRCEVRFRDSSAVGTTRFLNEAGRSLLSDRYRDETAEPKIVLG